MRVGLMSAAESTIFYRITKMAFTLLNVPQKSQPSDSCSCLERGHTRRFSVNAAALLGIEVEFGELRHKRALITEQFQLLKARTKDGTVTEQLLGLLNQAWALRCDGTLDEGEYAEDIRTVISEMSPPSRSSSMAAAPTLASQA